MPPTTAYGMPSLSSLEVMVRSVSWTGSVRMKNLAASWTAIEPPRRIISSNACIRPLLLLLRLLRPRVLQRHRPVEHEPPAPRLRVHAEIPQPLELVLRPHRRAAKARLQLGVFDHLQ